MASCKLCSHACSVQKGSIRNERGDPLPTDLARKESPGTGSNAAASELVQGSLACPTVGNTSRSSDRPQTGIAGKIVAFVFACQDVRFVIFVTFSWRPLDVAQTMSEDV